MIKKTTTFLIDKFLYWFLIIEDHFKKNRAQFKSRSKGFTLIETVLSVLILSTMAIGGAHIISESAGNNTNVNLSQTAYLLANNKLEKIFLTKQEDGFNSINQENYLSENVTVNGKNYLIITQINEVNPNNYAVNQENSGYKKIVVNVSFENQETKTISLSTLLTNQST